MRGLALAVILGGMSSGLVGSWLAMRFRPPLVAETPIASSTPVRSGGPENSHHAGLSALADAVRAGNQCRNGTMADASGAKPADGGAPEMMSREERMALNRHIQRNRIEAHRQEPREGKWAAAQEAAISRGFRALPETVTASMTEVECKSVSCLAKVQWQDLAKAQDEMLRLVVLSGDAAPNCVRHLVLDEHSGAGSQTATMVYECEDQIDPEENQ